MKAALLAGIAALLLATGTAHARCCVWSKCGNVFVQHQLVKEGYGRGKRHTDILLENPPLKFTYECSIRAGKCWLNGKLCREVSDEEYEKAYPKEKPEDRHEEDAPN